MKRELGIARCGLACCLCSENIICKGCKRDGFLELSWCKDAEWCEVRKCGIEKNINGCYECEPAGCRKGLYADKIKARTFAEFAHRYGVEALLNCLERNERAGVVYHREGIMGDYDDFDNMEDLISFIWTGKKESKVIETERLILRKWTQDDAESLFTYAKNPNVGPIAGWPPHKDIESSRQVIDNVFNGAECYAICEKENNIAIGAVELKLNGHTDMTDKDDECELGYWLGEPFWGRGYMPEAAKALLKRGFEELNMSTIWCGYYEGNSKSKRVQEKLGFVYHHTCDDVPVPLLNEVRIGHTNVMTKEQWYL